jgi:hypothetical protein
MGIVSISCAYNFVKQKLRIRIMAAKQFFITYKEKEKF